jgi:hypothetical protein
MTKKLPNESKSHPSKKRQRPRKPRPLKDEELKEIVGGLIGLGGTHIGC